MAIDQKLVQRKLALLHEFLRQLENMDFSQEDLLHQVDIQHLVLFRLQQAIETAIDIATQLIIGLDLPRQETARESFLILAKERVISQESAEKMAAAVGFRNLVVHQYADIKFDLVYRDYRDDIASLRKFANQIYGFLQLDQEQSGQREQE